MKNLFYLLIILFVSCSDEPEIREFQILNNPDMEKGQLGGPQAWYPHPMETMNYYVYRWCNEESYSPERSLMISQDDPNVETSAAWMQLYTEDIPRGHILEFSVNVKGVNIEGEGVEAVVCVPVTNDVKCFWVSDIPQGTFDWANFTVNTEGISNFRDQITVALYLRKNTTGTVYFDDVTLTYKKQE